MNIILSKKPWNSKLIAGLKEKCGGEWLLITDKKDFIFDNLKELDPKRIFIPHWSYIIKKEIYENFECIVFHMTDLPYGRGGSPLQNLISRRHKDTVVTALKVDKGIDTGDIYLKSPLSLNGNAEEIFIRANAVIYDMIMEIHEKNIQPKSQKGIPVEFKRRTPEMSDISDLISIESLFDQVRMLDAEGYPHAYLENEHFRFEFTRASLKSDETIIADVRIFKK